SSPGRRIKEAAELQQAEFELGFLAHAVAVPGRRPYQLDADLVDPRHRQSGLLDLAWHALRDRTGRRRQGHLDKDDAALFDDELVDQAELDGVDREFRGAHGPPPVEPPLAGR